MTRLHVRLSGHQSQSRTHLPLHKDAPLHRLVQRSGANIAIPILAGLHHQSGYDFRKGQAVERYLADFMITTFGFRFSVHTALN